MYRHALAFAGKPSLEHSSDSTMSLDGSTDSRRSPSPPSPGLPPSVAVPSPPPQPAACPAGACEEEEAKEASKGDELPKALSGVFDERTEHNLFTIGRLQSNDKLWVLPNNFLQIDCAPTLEPVRSIARSWHGQNGLRAARVAADSVRQFVTWMEQHASGTAGACDTEIWCAYDERLTRVSNGIQFLQKVYSSRDHDCGSVLAQIALMLQICQRKCRTLGLWSASK